MRGQVHEAYAHRFLAKQTNITVCYLDRKKEEAQLQLGVRTFKLFSDISELTTSDYGKPRVKNFAAVDSLVLPNVAFSMTVSCHHPTKAVPFKKVLKSMKDMGHAVSLLVFVVPNSSVHEFQEQNYLNAKGKKILEQDLDSSIKCIRQAVFAINY